MTDYKDLQKHLDSLTTLDEYRQVKSYVDDRIEASCVRKLVSI